MRHTFSVSLLNSLPAIKLALSQSDSLSNILALPIQRRFFRLRLSWSPYNPLIGFLYSSSCGCGNNGTKSSFRHVHSDHQFMPNRPTKELERKTNINTNSRNTENIPIRRKTSFRKLLPNKPSKEFERKNINASKRREADKNHVRPKSTFRHSTAKIWGSEKSPVYMKNSFGNVNNNNQVVPNRPSEEFERKNPKPTKRREAEKNPIYTRDIVTEVHNILKHSTWDSALEELERVPVKWDSFTVNRVLKTHPPMEKAWLFFNWASGLKGFKHDRFTYTTMLDIFGEAGRISSMKKVFKQMVERGIKVDVVSCTSLMHWVSESGDVDGAVRVWEELKRNCDPTVVSYTAYMKVLLRNDRATEALEAYAEMTGSGIMPNCYTYTVLMDYLIESGKSKEALDVFYEMQGAKVYPDKAACNILVEKLSKLGDTKTMSNILKYMRKNTIVLRYPVFLKALEAIKAARKNDILLWQVNRHCSIQSPVKAVNPLTPDEELISALVKKENLVASNSLLAEISDKNIKLNPETVSKIIEANCERHRDGEALQAFEYSMKIGTAIPKSSYLALLGVLFRSDSFSKIVEVVEEMVKAKHSVGIYLASILIRKLGRARKPELASRVFELLPRDQRCSATYTALIGAHFSVKSIEKGLEVFREMRSLGIAPSLGTYDLILDGLSRSGRVSEREFRKEKLNLRSNRDNSQHITIPFDQKICDLLYQGMPAV